MFDLSVEDSFDIFEFVMLFLVMFRIFSWYFFFLRVLVNFLSFLFINMFFLRFNFLVGFLLGSSNFWDSCWMFIILILLFDKLISLMDVNGEVLSMCVRVEYLLILIL